MAANWDWVWDSELKKYVIRTADGERYGIKYIKGNVQYPFKVEADSVGIERIENQGFARTLNEAKRIAREAAEGRPRLGMEGKEFKRAVRSHRRRTHKPLR